jgi:hypothetical protein
LAYFQGFDDWPHQFPRLNPQDIRTIAYSLPPREMLTLQRDRHRGFGDAKPFGERPLGHAAAVEKSSDIRGEEACELGGVHAVTIEICERNPTLIRRDW